MKKSLIRATADANVRDDRSEGEGHERAGAFLKDLIGAETIQLFWDHDHRSQGHVYVGDRELVVIAPRDKVHDVFVLTAEDWDEIRHTPGPLVGKLIQTRAIRDREGVNRPAMAAN